MALSDILQGLPNYVHPDYATPGQLAQAREYAKFLMEPGKGQIPVKSWQAGLANALNQGFAGWELGNAQRSEQKLYSQALRDQAGTIAQQNGLEPGQGVGAAPPVNSAPLPPVQPPPVPAASAAPPTMPSAPPGPAPGTPNERVAMGFADTNDAIKTGAFDPVGSNNIGPDGLSPSPYKTALAAPTAPVPSPAPPPMAAATAPPAAAPSSPGGAPIRMAQAGADPAAIARLLMNPVTPPQVKDYASSLIAPKPAEDVYGRPGVSTVAGGVRAQPVGPGFQPGVRSETSIAPESIHGQTFTPAPAPGQQPQATTPVMGSGLGGAMDTMNTLRMNSNRAGAVNEFQKQDLTAANDAPTIKRVAGVMLDDLNAHGDKMTFGPTAEWSNNLKRAAANYAPGFMKDQIEALASADSFEKMSAQLTSLLSKGGGTDAQLFNNMKSVPGAHNSQEGARALLQMTIQVANQQQALAQATAGARDYREYQEMKDRFYRQNPIINPITNNPIALDLKKDQEAGGWKDLGNGVRIRQK